MSNHQNLIGKRFGKLVVIKDIGRYSTNEIKWLCQCDCGNFRYAKRYYLNRGIKCCVKCNYQDFTGKQIGKLTVLRRCEDKQLKCGKTRIQWECICECGDVVIRTPYLLGRGNCCCKKCKAVIDKEKNNTGYKEISGTYWTSVKSQAEKRGFQFEVPIELAWSIFQKQNNCCAISGMKIEFAQNKKHYLERKNTASLDRINSSIGYTIDNIQWVHKWVNRMKSNHSQEEFIDICVKIAEYNHGKNIPNETAC